MSRFLLRAVSLALLIGLAGPRPGTGQGEASAGVEWHQWGGSASHDGSSSRRPVRAEPEELWRIDLDGTLVCEPVTWGGVLYLILEKFGSRKLHGFRVIDGSRLAHPRNLGRGQWSSLSVLNGRVVVGERGRLRGVTLRGGSLVGSWGKDPGVKGLGPPCLYRDRIYASDAKNLYVFDLSSGRRVETISGFAGPGRIGIGGLEDGAPLLVGAGFEVEKKKKVEVRFVAHSVPLDETLWSSGKIEESLRRFDLGPSREDVIRDQVFLSAVCLTRQGDGVGWCFAPPESKRKWRDRFVGLGTLRATPRYEKVASPTAVHEGRAYGFNLEGDLCSFGTGKPKVLVERSRLPRGARPGGATLCRDVFYFGNWAWDPASRRVLWTLPDVKPIFRAIPVRDGVFVVPTEDGSLIAYGDVESVGAIAAATTSSQRGSTEEPARPKAPSRPQTAVGEEYELLEGWRASVGLAYASALDELVRDYTKKKLIGAARALLQEARRYGMTEERTQFLERLMGGKKDHSSAEAIHRRLRSEEDAKRMEAYDGYRAGAAWCLANGLRAASACLLVDARSIHPELPNLDEEIQATIPPAFPFREDPNAAGLWSQWALALVPSGARFLPEGDRDWLRLSDPRDRRRGVDRRRGSIWTHDTLGLRTEHLVCFSLERNPEVVGACLRYGEGAVRTLQHFFTQDLPEKAEEADGRLEVRIHGTRETYLDEMGSRRVEWSAGYYSALEKVSRFFIPRGRDGKVADTSLYRVVAHELTHHFVEQRVVRNKKDLEFSRSDAPGYWVVEGIARFVEHQASDSVRAGRSFDDLTVQSIDVTAQMDRAGGIFPPGKLVELSQVAFSGLSRDSVGKVRLQHSFRSFTVNPLLLFYEQSAALAFFMLNRRGEEGREAFLDYLQDYYRGRLTKKSWRKLGFETSDELSRAFGEFLTEVRTGGGGSPGDDSDRGVETRTTPSVPKK